jgi:hypothetical protein
MKNKLIEYSLASLIAILILWILGTFVVAKHTLYQFLYSLGVGFIVILFWITVSLIIYFLFSKIKILIEGIKNGNSASSRKTKKIKK